MGTFSLQTFSPAERFGCTNNFHSQMVSLVSSLARVQLAKAVNFFLLFKKSLCHHYCGDTGHKASVSKLNSIRSSLSFTCLNICQTAATVPPRLRLFTSKEKKIHFGKTRLVTPLPRYILSLTRLLGRVATGLEPGGSSADRFSLKWCPQNNLKIIESGLIPIITGSPQLKQRRTTLTQRFARPKEIILPGGRGCLRMEEFDFPDSGRSVRGSWLQLHALSTLK